MKAFNEKVVLRNVIADPQTGKQDLIAAVETPVTVYLTGTTTLAQIFDIDENPIGNPLTTDLKGNFVFKANDGTYDIVGGTAGNETRWDEIQLIDLADKTNMPFSFTATQGQTDFELNSDYGQSPTVIELSINGRIQDSLGSNGDTPSYSISGSMITLSNPVNLGDKVVGVANKTAPTAIEVSTGRHIKVSYPSLRGFLNTSSPSLQIDDYIEFRGLAVEGDGMGSVYQVKTGSEFDYSKVIPVYEGVVAKYVSGFNKRLRTDNYEIAAHRGFTHFNVEGTMYAFTSALEYGADSLECDVQFTSDGEMVLYHDIDTTEHDLNNITGRIKDNTYAQVQAATFKQLDGNFMQPYVQVARFTELLDYIRLAGCRAHIEIKAYRTEDDIQSIVNAITERDIEGLVVLHSFRLTDIQYVRNINEQIQVSLLATVTTGNDSGGVPLTEGYDWLKRDKNSMFAVSLFGIDNDIPNGQEFVKVLQDAGVQVAAWTTETEIDLMFARRNNINVIISDLPIYRKQPTRIRYEQSF